MSSCLLRFTSFIHKTPEISFNEWQRTQQEQQKKQDRLLWGASLIGSSIVFIGIISVIFHMPHQKTTTLTAELPPAITIDLSTDIIPPSPPAMAAQPEAQPLEEQSIPLDAPVAAHPDILLPKTHHIEKIKPVQPPKTIHPPTTKPKQTSKPITPVHNKINDAVTSSNTTSSSPSSNTVSHSQSSISPASWQSSILEKLKQLKQYPTEALSDKQEGIAKVKITINRQGKVLSAQLAKSSGHSLLDKEAVALAYRANPLPSVPESIKGNIVSLTVPVQFDLY